MPPFPGSIAKFLALDSAFHRRHGVITAFVAKRAGRAVGRVAAIINRSHNEYNKDRIGFFGFFECENNPATAAALLGKVTETLLAAGMDGVRGPYNPSINDDCGILLNRFDQQPIIGLPWNPSYYSKLLEDMGFQKSARFTRSICRFIDSNRRSASGGSWST